MSLHRKHHRVHRREMDELFERLLPSASPEQYESSRARILERVRAGVSAVHETADVLPLNYGDYHILLVLEEGERHAHAILSEVEEVTEGATRFGPGTLHTSIDRLLTAGLIEESSARPDPRLNDENRQYYRLTRIGQHALAAESDRFADLSRQMHGPRIVRSL